MVVLTVSVICNIIVIAVISVAGVWLVNEWFEK
jgi:hypothetical protein